MAKYWGLIVIVALIVVAIRMIMGLRAIQYGDMIMSAISGFLIGLIVISILTPAKRTA